MPHDQGAATRPPGTFLLIPEPARGQVLLAHAALGNLGRQRAAGRQRRGYAGHPGSGLDPVAALPCEPEEAGRIGRITYDRRLVGHEVPQACPSAFDAAHPKGGRPLDAVHADGEVQLIGLHVVRWDRALVGRRAENPPGVWLEVEGLVDVTLTAHAAFMTAEASARVMRMRCEILRDELDPLGA